MTRLRSLEIALLLFLIGIPLVSVGAKSDRPSLWGLGLFVFVIGGLLPPLTRYVFTSSDPREEADVKDEP